MMSIASIGTDVKEIAAIYQKRGDSMTQEQCNTCSAPPDALCRSKEWGYLIAASCLNYEPKKGEMIK